MQDNPLECILIESVCRAPLINQDSFGITIVKMNSDNNGFIIMRLNDGYILLEKLIFASRASNSPASESMSEPSMARIWQSYLLR